MFYREIQNLPARIIIDFINAFNAKVDYPTKVGFSAMSQKVVDDKNTETVFYAQTIQGDRTPERWFKFTMRHANDFSCSNVYLDELDGNPLIIKKAEKWMRDNYDEGGQYEKADMIHAYIEGFNRK